MVREPNLISVVSPVLDEAEVLEAFHERVSAALEEWEFELDPRRRRLLGSGRPRSSTELAARDPRVRVVICRGTSARRRPSAPGSITPAATWS